MKLTPEAQAYARELAAEIATNGNPCGDLVDELKAAHARRQAFAAEMRDGYTPRSKMVRKVMALNIHARVQQAANVTRCMHDCAEVAA